MNTRTPAAMAAVSLSLLLALTACGGGEDSPDADATEEAASSGSALSDLLDNLGSSTQDITNYTLDMESVALDPVDGDVSIVYNYQVMDDPAAVRASVSMPSYGEMMFELMDGMLPEGVTAEDLGTTTVIMQEGEEALVADPHGITGPGTPWIRGESSEDSADPTESFDLEALPELAGAFSVLENAEEVGTEEIGGVETTVIEGSMTAGEISDMTAEEREAVELLFGGELGGDMDAKIWVDADGFPMRMEFSDDESQVWMEFSDIGTTSFEFPSEDEIGTV